MAPESVQARIIELVAEIFNEDQGDIDLETDFIDDLQAKSMDVIALIAALEDEFGLSLSVSDAQNNRTIGEAIEWLNEQLDQS